MPVLELRELKKNYAGPGGKRRSVINIAALELNNGEQAALEGGSGSGKTTLLNLIAGIISPDSGTIRVGGRELTALGESERDRARAAAIGYIFQTFNLLQGLTALENVLIAMSFAAGVDVKAATALLKRVGLEDKLDHYPAQLSAGQQQRVAVVRALANKPKLVLADEPTSSLDKKLSWDVVGLIRELCRENGAALLLASHDQAALRQFGRVLRLEELNLTRGAGK
jgi:ABC-type lipoprotein export system ATPase subunit